MTIDQKFNGLTGNFNLVPDVPSEIGAITNEPTGVISSQFTVTYDSATRTLTITPVSTSFDVYIKGVRIIKTGVQTVTHANVAGEYFFEYDSTGTLTASTTPFDFLERAQIAVVRFDPAQTPTGWRLVETHGVTLDGASHSILHATIGTRLVSGGTITNGTIVTYLPTDTYNAANSQLATIQPGIDATVLADEDISTSLPALIEATGYTVLRKRWTANNYEWLTAQTAPFYHVANVPQYNPSSGGDNWVAMTNAAYTCWYLVGIPAGTEAESQTMRYFWFNGGVQYVPTSAALAAREVARNNALAEDPSNINLTDLISTEYNIMHKLVMVYVTGNTGNDYRLRVAGSQSVRGNRARPIVSSGIVPTNHGSLSGLTDPNAHPATSISTDPTSGALDPAIETNVELAIDRMSEYGYCGVWTTSKAYRIGNIVKDTDGQFYRCIAAHTSTASLDTDAASWEHVRQDIRRITQSSHGFTVGQVLYLNGSTYALAKADNANTSEVIGVVSNVVTANSFDLCVSGYLFDQSGLTSGSNYFLSSATAGLATATEPATVGHISKPIYIAISTSEAIVNIMRGVTIGTANAYTTVSLANNASTAIQNVSTLTGGGRIDAELIIDATSDYGAHLSIYWVRDAGTWKVSYSVNSGTTPTPASGFDVTISAGVISITLPNLAGFVSASVRFSINAASAGANILSVPSSIVLGRVDGVAPSAGFIGEVIEAGATGASLSSGSGVTGVTSITLSAGHWLVDAVYEVQSSTIAGWSLIVSDTSSSSNSLAGAIGGENDKAMATTNTSAFYVRNISGLVYKASTSKTIYLNTYRGATVSGSSISYRLRAIRIA